MNFRFPFPLNTLFSDLKPSVWYLSISAAQISPVVLLWHLLPACLGIPPTRRCMEKPHPVDVVWAEPTAPKSNLFGPTGIHMPYTNIGVLYINTYPRCAHYAIVKIFEKRERIKVKAKWKILNVRCNAKKQRGQFSR